MGACRGFYFVGETSAQFDPQNAGYRIVNARQGQGAALYLGYGVGYKLLPGIGHHYHIYTGHNRLGALGVAAAGHLAMAVPVAYYKAVKAHLLL